jgi:hypothetical protein
MTLFIFAAYVILILIFHKFKKRVILVSHMNEASIQNFDPSVTSNTHIFHSGQYNSNYPQHVINDPPPPYSLIS